MHGREREHKSCLQVDQLKVLSNAYIFLLAFLK